MATNLKNNQEASRSMVSLYAQDLQMLARMACSIAEEVHRAERNLSVKIISALMNHPQVALD